jgi:hypothetical protein
MHNLYPRLISFKTPDHDHILSRFKAIGEYAVLPEQIVKEFYRAKIHLNTAAIPATLKTSILNQLIDYCLFFLYFGKFDKNDLPKNIVRFAKRIYRAASVKGAYCRFLKGIITK